jgi:bacterioferritin-associated ferredoxin
MIVCACTGITDVQLRAAVDWIRAADPRVVITPGRVYRALGRRSDCGGCLPLVLSTLASCEGYGVPINLRGLRRAARQEGENEGRSEGHRVSERRAAQ